MLKNKNKIFATAFFLITICLVISGCNAAETAQIQPPSGLWEWLIRDVFGKMFGEKNYGWCIIVFTIFLRLLLLPIDFFQRKITLDNKKKSELMQPYMENIQKKYAGDRMAMQAKTRELQKKFRYNTFGACLPAIVSMVIFITMFNGMRNISNFKIYQSFEQPQNAYLAAATGREWKPGDEWAKNDPDCGADSDYIAEMSALYDALFPNGEFIYTDENNNEVKSQKPIHFYVPDDPDKAILQSVCDNLALLNSKERNAKREEELKTVRNNDYGFNYYDLQAAMKAAAGGVTDDRFYKAEKSGAAYSFEYELTNLDKISFTYTPAGPDEEAVFNGKDKDGRNYVCRLYESGEVRIDRIEEESLVNILTNAWAYDGGADVYTIYRNKYLIYNTVFDIKKDDNGEAVYEKDNKGKTVTDKDGNPVPVLVPRQVFTGATLSQKEYIVYTALSVDLGRDAAHGEFKEHQRTGFLWIKNVWRPDAAWTLNQNCSGGYTVKPIPDGAQFIAPLPKNAGGCGGCNCGRYNTQLGKKIGDGKEIVSEYNLILGKAIYSDEANKVFNEDLNKGVNGYYILVVLIIALSILSTKFNAAGNPAPPPAADGMPNQQNTMKMMMWMMPVMLAFFALTSTAIFSIYMVTNSAMALASTFLCGYFIKLYEKKKEAGSGAPKGGKGKGGKGGKGPAAPPRQKYQRYEKK